MLRTAAIEHHLISFLPYVCMAVEAMEQEIEDGKN